MKKQLFIALLAVSTMWGCKPEEEIIVVKGVSVSPASLSIKPGETSTLVATVLPTNVVNKNVTWASSDTTIAKVNNSGVVSAVKPGSATIKVTTQEKGEVATSSITVSANDPITAKGEVSGVWKKYSTVNVTGHITVPAGATLTIEEGVEIIMATGGVDANKTKIEFIVHGKLYAVGTKSAPVLFTIPAAERTAANTFGRAWGGIIGSTTCSEILLDNVIVEYTGATTTSASPSSVLGLFKAAGGENMVAFNTNNPTGKYVITNSTFRNNGEDAIYVQGGSCIFMNNLFHAVGESGGEAINVKAGTKVDAAGNIMFSPNTNAFKLSNSGASASRPQAQIYAYNNTIINSGWRRDPNKPKGGSVWLEAGVLAYVYNNLVVNSMFGNKAPSFGVNATIGPDVNSKMEYNFFASGTQKSTIPQHVTNGTITAFDGFKPGVVDLVRNTTDIYAGSAGDATKDPKFVNFPLNDTPVASFTYNPSWDFRLQASSPALNGAKTNFTPFFSTTGLTLNGKEYKSPAPAAYFGAKGIN